LFLVFWQSLKILASPFSPDSGMRSNAFLREYVSAIFSFGQIVERSRRNTLASHPKARGLPSGFESSCTMEAGSGYIIPSFMALASSFSGERKVWISFFR
jgi:hypothetical protein